MFFYVQLFRMVYGSRICGCAAKKFVNRGFLNGPLCPIYGIKVGSDANAFFAGKGKDVIPYEAR